jgi:hypothetical protein
MLITRTSLCTIHKVRRWQLVVSGILKKIMNRVGKVVSKRGNQRLQIFPIVDPSFKCYEGVIFSPSASLFFARNKNRTISILGIKNQSVYVSNSTKKILWKMQLQLIYLFVFPTFRSIYYLILLDTPVERTGNKNVDIKFIAHDAFLE